MEPSLVIKLWFTFHRKSGSQETIYKKQFCKQRGCHVRSFMITISFSQAVKMVQNRNKYKKNKPKFKSSESAVSNAVKSKI